MTIGIICEYNPFHFGHLHHINCIKKMYPNSSIILVLTGWISERGDISMIDKWKKTEIALNYGIDLVVELPFKFIQSADIFAKGALAILNKLNCNKIVFGSEANDINLLRELASIQLNNNNYDYLVKKYLNSGINYPTALSKALVDISGKTVDTPNDLLGLSYIKEIIKNNYNIEPITIKRTSDFNSKNIEGIITSATSIRELIKNNKDFSNYIPSIEYDYLKETIFIDDYFDYLKYKIISSDNLTIYQGINTNLENRIKKFINCSNNLEELINNIKTKRYTYNRIKRMLTFILLSLKKEEFNNLELTYIRLLGFNTNGKNFLNTIKKNIDIPILTKFDPYYLNTDLKINNILSLNKKIINKKQFIEKEYKQKPIKKSE